MNKYMKIIKQLEFRKQTEEAKFEAFSVMCEKVAELEAKIEKMKCCQNCKNTWNGYRLDICDDCKDRNKWELRR